MEYIAVTLVAVVVATVATLTGLFMKKGLDTVTVPVAKKESSNSIEAI